MRFQSLANERYRNLAIDESRDLILQMRAVGMAAVLTVQIW